MKGKGEILQVTRKKVTPKLLTEARGFFNRKAQDSPTILLFNILDADDS